LGWRTNRSITALGDTVDDAVSVLHANAFANNNVIPVLVAGAHFSASATPVGRWVPATSAGMTVLDFAHALNNQLATFFAASTSHAA